MKQRRFIFPPRILILNKEWKEELPLDDDQVGGNKKIKAQKEEMLEVKKTDLYKLGIIEYEEFEDTDKYPIITGKGQVNEGIALIEMVARRFKLPMRKELCKRFLEQQKQRGKN